MDGQMTKDQSLESLRQLCTEKREVVGQLVRLLAQANAAGSTGVTGTCVTTSGSYPATEAKCNRDPNKIDWHPLIPPEKMPSILPELVTPEPEPIQKLRQLFAENPDTIRRVDELVRNVNSSKVDPPVGICCTQQGECIPGTQTECDRISGNWSSILPG